MTNETNEQTETNVISVGVVTHDADDFHRLTEHDDVFIFGNGAGAGSAHCFTALAQNGVAVAVIDNAAVLAGPQAVADAAMSRAGYFEDRARHWRDVAKGLSECTAWPGLDDYERLTLEMKALNLGDFNDVANAAVRAHVQSMTTAQLAELVKAAESLPEDVPF